MTSADDGLFHFGMVNKISDVAQAVFRAMFLRLQLHTATAAPFVLVIEYFLQVQNRQSQGIDLQNFRA